jgi:hypothetical protein
MGKSEVRGRRSELGTGSSELGTERALDPVVVVVIVVVVKCRPHSHLA